MYHVHWNPDPSDHEKGSSFEVWLAPAWREEVALLGWTQTDVDAWVRSRGARLLTQHFPDWRNMTTGLPDTRYFGVRWGEWGPDLIVVPGNAAGLFIDPDADEDDPRGRRMTCSNMDTLHQASLALAVFSHFAHTLYLSRLVRADKEPQ